MSKFILPIKSTYVGDWSSWESCRELVQNAKDEEEQRHHAMTVEWSRVSGQKGVLCIHNEGADMDRKALLVGHSSKAGAGLRGRFGEGLNLAMLAGVRAGHQIVVETQSERWTPSLAYSQEFGETCLAVSTRALKVRRSGVTVTMTLAEDRWLEFRDRFLFLAQIPDGQLVRVPDKGAILLQPERKGHVYVKGIFVDKLPKLECGYDLDNMRLDRDRRMIDHWDLQWTLAGMYSEAMARRPAALAASVYKMLRDESDDTKLLQHFVTDEVAEQVSASFCAEHGENAVPVTSMAESAELEHLGKRGVVVSPTLRDVVKSKTGDITSLKSSLGTQAVCSYAWGDLTDDERGVLTATATELDRATKALRPGSGILDRLDVVDFRDERLHGLAQRGTGRVKLARKLLADPPQTMTTLVHEEAHAISQDGDGAKGHVSMIEEIWARLYFRDWTGPSRPVATPEAKADQDAVDF